MKKILCFFLAFFLLIQPLIADDRNNADQVLKNAIEAVVKLLRDQHIDKEAKRSGVMEIIESVFDFKLMAKLTLGKKHWPRLKPNEKKEFVKLFIKQLENTYYSETKFFSEEMIEFEKPKKVKKRIHILTRVFPKDKKIEILYKLYNTHGTWKIYDAEIQGVSIISSFRAQYKQFLNKGTVSDFLKKMRSMDK